MTRHTMIALCLFLAAGAAPVTAAPADGRVLQQAYQKEFAYLLSTTQQLKERIDQVEAATARDAKGAAAELATLEQALLTDQKRADDLERQLGRAAQAADAKAELDVDDLLQQVSSERTKLGGAPLKEHDDPLRALERALDDLHRLHAEQATLRRAAGVFFDAEGRKLKGEVVRLGGLAAWGVAGGHAGPLSPAGGGAFKLWPESTGLGVEGLLSGEPPALVDTFLFASEAHAVDVKKDKAPLEIVRAGGAVAWVIVGLGGLAGILITLRALLLMWLGRGRTSLIEAVQALVRAGRSAEALRRCKTRAGAMGELLTTAVQWTAVPREARADLLEEALLRALPAADRFGAMIIVIAAASPLLGLLGTVSGMISTFDVITEHGTGDPRMLSGGISEALITTELGLIVAIPALFFGNLLMGWGDRLKRELEAAALGVAYADDVSDVLLEERA